MKLYVFETDKWLESEIVYPHDVALCVLAEDKIIYVWEGNRTTPAIRKTAQEGLESITNKFPQYTIQKIDETTPASVTNFINQFVNTSFEEVEKIERTPQFVAFLYIMVALFGGVLVGYIMILRLLGWDIVSETSYYIISELNYSRWVSQNIIILIVISSIFVVSLVFAFLTKKLFLIVTSGVGILVLTGTILYFYLGVYLFDFHPDIAPEGYYYLTRGSIAVFSILNLIALGIIITPMIISILAIIQTTIPISWSEWIENRKKAVIEMKKFSILEDLPEFTEVEKQDFEEISDKEQDH